MSLYLGNDISGTKILHLTAGDTSANAMKSGILAILCFIAI